MTRDALPVVVADRLMDPAWLAQQERNRALDAWSPIDDVEAEQHVASQLEVAS